jgi:YgiT-type zinc finger domain-containing protein
VMCVARKGGQTRPGRTAVTPERETTTLVFKAVPVEICANCGEAYVGGEVSRHASLASLPANPIRRSLAPAAWLREPARRPHR